MKKWTSYGAANPVVGWQCSAIFSSIGQPREHGLGQTSIPVGFVLHPILFYLSSFTLLSWRVWAAKEVVLLNAPPRINETRMESRGTSRPGAVEPGARQPLVHQRSALLCSNRGVVAQPARAFRALEHGSPALSPLGTGRGGGGAILGRAIARLRLVYGRFDDGQGPRSGGGAKARLQPKD